LNTALQLSLLSLVNNSTDYIATADRDGNLIYINRAGREMIGLGPGQDISGMNSKDFYLPRDFEKVVQEVLPSLENNSRWN
jgi:PAS domain S-box-containing protein